MRSLVAITLLFLSAIGHAADPAAKTEFATFGGGCFWGMEAVFERVPGVVNVVNGYAGGNTVDPEDWQVASGKTGHAQVVQIEFDPTIVSYARLLQVFFLAHDPTMLNHQYDDVGPQYRSIILYHDEAQQKEALRRKSEAQPQHKREIVTEIVPFVKFYPAEAFHQDFYRNNPNAPYCRVSIGFLFYRLEGKGVFRRIPPVSP